MYVYIFDNSDTCNLLSWFFFLRDFTQFVPSLQDFFVWPNKPFGLAGCAISKHFAF